jgi:hypothetical protein
MNQIEKDKYRMFSAMLQNLDLRKTMCVKLGLLGMRTSGRQTVKGEGEGG